MVILLSKKAGITFLIGLLLCFSFMFYLAPGKAVSQVVCGDVDGITGTDIGDVVWMVEHQFLGGPEPLPELCASDIDGILGVDIGDLVHMVEYQFQSGSPPLGDCCPECFQGETEPCYLGPPQTQNVGECTDGYRACIDGEWGACVDQVLPATEVCDNLDNDCDGTDDEDAVDASIWYRDADQDGFGDPQNIVFACSQPAGYVMNSLDCNDANPTIFPGAPELCDGLDNNCNFTVDDNPVGGSIYHYDFDDDGYGNGNTMLLCGPTGFYRALQPGDCNDTDPSIHPGVSDPCDGINNDCDGNTDEDANCNYPNASGVCNGASGCALSTCNNGWANYDGITSNGCEFDLDINLNCFNVTTSFSMCGDGNCGLYQRSYNGIGEKVFRGYFEECCSGLFTNDDFNVRFRLIVPPGVDYDLYIYDDACNVVASSRLGSSADEEVVITWNDVLAVDDSEYYRAEVRFYSGTSNTEWTLDIDSWGSKRANPSGKDDVSESTMKVAKENRNPDKEATDDAN